VGRGEGGVSTAVGYRSPNNSVNIASGGGKKERTCRQNLLGERMPSHALPEIDPLIMCLEGGDRGGHRSRSPYEPPGQTKGRGGGSQDGEKKPGRKKSTYLGRVAFDA